VLVAGVLFAAVVIWGALIWGALLRGGAVSLAMLISFGLDMLILIFTGVAPTFTVVSVVWSAVVWPWVAVMPSTGIGKLIFIGTVVSAVLSWPPVVEDMSLNLNVNTLLDYPPNLII
jgi:hypothetical protein